MDTNSDSECFIDISYRINYASYGLFGFFFASNFFFAHWHHLWYGVFQYQTATNKMLSTKSKIMNNVSNILETSARCLKSGDYDSVIILILVGNRYESKQSQRTNQLDIVNVFGTLLNLYAAIFMAFTKKVEPHTPNLIKFPKIAAVIFGSLYLFTTRLAFGTTWNKTKTKKKEEQKHKNDNNYQESVFPSLAPKLTAGNRHLIHSVDFIISDSYWIIIISTHNNSPLHSSFFIRISLRHLSNRVFAV